MGQPAITAGMACGKQNAETEFGAKIEISVINGYLRIEKLSWDALNESKTLQASARRFLSVYGCYPARILADAIFRTKDNFAFCKQHGIHMNGPKPESSLPMSPCAGNNCRTNGMSPAKAKEEKSNEISESQSAAALLEK